MTFNSYAQNFEDVMLWRALSHVQGGFYVDIGAQDPIIDSVSHAFHERGWRGIHVEPVQHYAELLRQQRPGDEVIQAAVGNGPTLLRFYETPGGGISTADANIAARHRESGVHIVEITVPCVALSAIFDACTAPEIHWLKIDVEGYERQVLASWGPSRTSPWIIVIESTLPLTQIETHEQWEALLIDRGYRFVYFDGLNRYYISAAHPEMESAFLTPPNVFDNFSLNGTSSASFHKVMEARHRETISQLLTQSDLREQSANATIERLTRDMTSLEETKALQEQLQNLLPTLAAREQELGAKLLVEFTATREQHAGAQALLEVALREGVASLAARDAQVREQSDRAQQLEVRLIEATKHAFSLGQDLSLLRTELTESRERVAAAETIAATNEDRLRDEAQIALYAANEVARGLRERLAATEASAVARERGLRDEAQITLDAAKTVAREFRERHAEQERKHTHRVLEIEEQAAQMSAQLLRDAEREKDLRAELKALRLQSDRLQAASSDREHRLREALESAKSAALRNALAQANEKAAVEQVLADTRELLAEYEREKSLIAAARASVRDEHSRHTAAMEQLQNSARAVETRFRTDLAAQVIEITALRRQLERLEASFAVRLSNYFRRWLFVSSRNR
jgi:FkbM family methyltransferase